MIAPTSTASAEPEAATTPDRVEDWKKSALEIIDRLQEELRLIRRSSAFTSGLPQSRSTVA